MTPTMADTTNAGSPASGPRIVTLTMNPVLDIATSTEIVMPTEKMRCGAARYDPGGGGLNVARVADALGARVLALFPAGGATGDRVADMLEAAGLPSRLIPIAEATRESFTVNERLTERQFRFVLPGPFLSTAEQEDCLEQLRSAAATADFVVASGSLPPGVSTGFLQPDRRCVRAGGHPTDPRRLRQRSAPPDGRQGVPAQTQCPRAAGMPRLRVARRSGTGGSGPAAHRSGGLHATCWCRWARKVRFWSPPTARSATRRWWYRPAAVSVQAMRWSPGSPAG